MPVFSSTTSAPNYHSRLKVLSAIADVEETANPWEGEESGTLKTWSGTQQEEG